MPHYVLGFLPSTQDLVYFYATFDEEEAMESRSSLERESRKMGFYDIVAISIDAPDLFEVFQMHSGYFTQVGKQRLIKDCFFCRAYLGDFPIMSDVDRLSQEAKRHGHCLLCHSVYPVLGDDGQLYIATALRHHARSCTARARPFPP